MAHNLVRNCACGDLARPAHYLRNTESSLPAGVFLVTEWGHGCIGPGVHMWSVVRAVDNNSIIRNAYFVQQVEKHAYLPLVLHHGLMVRGLPAPRLSPYSFRDVSPEMHLCSVEPDEERLFRLMLAFDKIDGCIQKFLVYFFHSFSGQRASILDATVGIAMDYTPGTKVLPEIRKVF